MNKLFNSIKLLIFCFAYIIWIIFLKLAIKKNNDIKQSGNFEFLNGAKFFNESIYFIYKKDYNKKFQKNINYKSKQKLNITLEFQRNNEKMDTKIKINNYLGKNLIFRTLIDKDDFKNFKLKKFNLEDKKNKLIMIFDSYFPFKINIILNDNLYYIKLISYNNNSTMAKFIIKFYFSFSYLLIFSIFSLIFSIKDDGNLNEEIKNWHFLNSFFVFIFVYFMIKYFYYLEFFIGLYFIIIKFCSSIFFSLIFVYL